MDRHNRLFLPSPVALATGLCLCLPIAAVALVRPSLAEENAIDGADAPRPLWSFAWVSDMHMGQATPEYIAKAFGYIDAELKPHFVLITGDNNFVEAPPADPSQPESLGLRRQRFLKTFLQENLKTPYAVIPGDDWPQEFDKVFGPKQYSFDCGGLHFILLAPDRIYHGRKREGLSVFNQPTWDWIARDLQRSREQATIVAIHEPIVPPTFLDAPPLRNLLNRYSNVFAVLQGHLHVNMEFCRDGRTYLVAPSLGRPPALAMKLVEVYPKGLVLRTIAYRKSGDCFEMTGRPQKIEIPQALRGGLAAPAGAKFTMANYDAVPASPLVEDPALESRVGELMKNAAKFLLPVE